LQHAGTYKEHFDIALSKRALAIQDGAVEISWEDAGEIIAARRQRVLDGHHAAP
jgi:hypothetical protein